MNFFPIGFQPEGEDPLHPDDYHFHTINRMFAYAFSCQLCRHFQPVPEDALFITKATFYSMPVLEACLVCTDIENEETMQWAYIVETILPTTWDEEAKIWIQNEAEQHDIVFNFNHTNSNGCANDSVHRIGFN